ncbi:MAG: aconitase family protein, partial [Oceanidesulfovibrio sp.]
GPGVETLTVPERATITNMGAELGATTSLFPADSQAEAFLLSMGRPEDYEEWVADEGATYDETIEIDLSTLEPLAAQPHMPDRVVPVRELAGMKVSQSAIGSCTNSSYADLKSVALMLAGKRLSETTDLLVSPGSKQVMKMLASENLIEPLLDAGARILEASCGPCIGMGGSPISEGVSVRTFNRNFEGRSGTQDARVYLTSPLVAAQVALDGQFGDPAGWGEPPQFPELPATAPSIRHLFIYPPEDGSDVEVIRGPNIVPLECFPEMPATIDTRILLKTGDDITTDHILPAGAQITALRSNIPAISEYIFSRVDADFVKRMKSADDGPCRGVILGGDNYGQGSSREHAALGPRHLGVCAVIAKSLARIHRANLVNFGILPLILKDPADYDRLSQGTELTIPACSIQPGESIAMDAHGVGPVEVTNDLTATELAIIQAGGLLNYVRAKREHTA